MGAVEGQVTDWRPYIPDDVKSDASLKPIIDKMTEPDVPTLIKSHVHAQRRLGNSITIPTKDSKPDEVAAFREKGYESGVFRRPPSKPEEYDFKKPENFPEGLNWSDEIADDFRKVMHKHGVPKEAAAEFLEIHNKALGGQQEFLKTSEEETMKSLREEHKDKFDERWGIAERFMPVIFKSEDEINLMNKLGLGNHATFMGILMRLAPFAQQDSSFMAELDKGASGAGGGSSDAIKAKEELAQIMNDPKHPKYEGYHRGDKAVHDYLDGLYRRVYGEGKVQITGPGATGASARN